MTDIVKTEEHALALTRPKGLEERSLKEDLIIPRAKLFHGLPSERDEFPNGQPGQVLNSITQEVLPATFVPFMKFYQWIRWNPRNTKDPNFNPEFGPGDAVWKSFNPYDERVQREGAFGPNGEAPLATKYISFIVKFDGVDMPVVLGFSKTSIRAGKQLLTTLEYLKCPIWHRKFKLGTRKEQGDAGSYYVYTIAPEGESDADSRETCGAWYEGFKAKAQDLKIHDEAAESTTDKAPF